MKVTVVKVGTPTGIRAIRFYCGRGSVMGNPHLMKRFSPTERRRVCDLYEKEFPNGPQKDRCKEMVKEAREEKAEVIELECFCAPLRCHCDTIKAYLERTYFSSRQHPGA